MVSARKVVTENLQKLDKSIHSPEGMAALAKVEALRVPCVKGSDAVMKLIEEGEHDSAVKLLMGDVRDAQLKYIDAVTKLVDLQEALMAKHGKEANIWGYLGLDCMMIIENAIKQVTANGGAWSQEKFRDAIENTKDLPVFTAAKFTFEKNTHNPYNKPVLLIQIKDGKFKILESYAPKG